MKLLNSGIVLAIIGAIMSLGTTAGLLYTEREAIFGPQKIAPVGTLPLSHLWGFDAQEVDALVAELKTERVKLIERQTDLDRVAAHVEAEKRELETTRAEVAAMRDEISAEIPKVQDSEKKNLKTLAQTYSTMAPTAVVAIFHDMDDSMCVKLLSLMKPAIVGAILQEMSLQDKDDTLTKRAARISDKLRLILDEPKPSA